MLERVLYELTTKFNTAPENPLVGVVRLTGFVHTEERVAFREIARQLCQYVQLPIFQLGLQLLPGSRVGGRIRIGLDNINLHEKLGVRLDNRFLVSKLLA